MSALVGDIIIIINTANSTGAREPGMVNRFAQVVQIWSLIVRIQAQALTSRGPLQGRPSEGDTELRSRVTEGRATPVRAPTIESVSAIPGQSLSGEMLCLLFTPSDLISLLLSCN